MAKNKIPTVKLRRISAGNLKNYFFFFTVIGIASIHFVRIVTLDSLIFQIDSLSKQSKYTFLIKQSMRKETLNGINSIGLIITNN